MGRVFWKRFGRSGTFGEDDDHLFRMVIKTTKHKMKKMHYVAIYGHQTMKRHTTIMMRGGVVMR